MSDAADTANLIPAPTATAVLDHVVRSLVDDPESVSIEAVEGRRGVTLEVRVAPGDMGRLIGKRGRVIQAVRQVVRASAAAEGIKATVDVAD